jgi:hypothetical protein
MRLGSSDTDDAGRTAAETEADERTVDDTVADDGTTAQPTFTPAARQPGDDAADDTAAQTPTVVEPADDDYRDDAVAGDERAGAYRDGSVDRPSVRYAEVETVQTVEPSGNYRPDEEAVPAGNYTVADTEAPAAGYDTDAAGTPVTTPAAATTPVAATTPAAAPAPAGGAALEQPLLSGNTELLAQWQQVQAQFVEDPQIAVSGAADLVEQAAHALVDALEQRQRQMRGIWDRNGSAAPGESVDTEQMRQMMQRYRALFNQLSQPA